MRVSGVPDRDQYSTQRFWITLVEASARVGTWKQWFWVDGGGGNFEFHSLPAGRYEFRLHDHFSDRTNSWETIYDRVTLEIIYTAPGDVAVDFLVPNPVPIYTPIEASVSGLEPKLAYWVTIVPQGTPDGRWEKWQDLRDTQSQSIRFDGYEPGAYELRVHDYRSGYELLARAPFSVSWNIGPASEVPRCPPTYNGQPETLVCRCDTEVTGSIWGTDVYTTGSSICLAAVHAGVIQSPAGQDQLMTVLVRRQPGADVYTASLRNGVQSTAYGRWGTSFVVSRPTSQGQVDTSRDDASNTAAFIAARLFLIESNAVDDSSDGVNYQYNRWGDSEEDHVPGRCDAYEGGHSGIDIQTKDVAGSATTDRPFYSLSRGIVISDGEDRHNTIAVYDRERDITFLYLHARQIDVVADQQVLVGHRLGIQGDTGIPGAEHVHFEVRSGRHVTHACGAADDSSLDPVATAASYL